MLTKTLRFEEDVQDVFRNMIWTDEGKTGDITQQLDPSLYKKVKKAIEAVGGSWDKRAKTHRFASDPRPLILGLIQNGTLTVDRDGFFRTPDKVVQKMLSYVPLPAGFDFNTLEPSCGDGAIISNLLTTGVIAKRLYAIEQNPKRCQIIRDNFPGVRVACGDFMKFRNSAHISFHRIFMNPPFEQGQDAGHVRKAYSLLSSDGKMAAILGEGIFFRDDRKSETFRAWMKAVGAYEERLPEGSFRESGTNVNTRLLILEKV